MQIRWRHELKKFNGLNVLTLGELGWSFDKDSFYTSTVANLYKSSDVIICESSDATRLRDSSRSRNSPFVTVAIDSRSSLTTPSHGGRSSELDDMESSSWWTYIIQHLVKPVTKTIIVSSTLMVDSKETTEGFTPTPQTKQDIELMSLKFAFIRHHLFHSNNALYGKRVFRWAKRHCIAMKNQSALEHSKNIFKCSVGGKGILRKAMEVLTHVHEEVDIDLPSVFPNWLVHFCPLTDCQRQAYERDCNFVRYSLAGTDNLSAGDNFSSFAKALLRLRRSCFHSNLHNALNSGIHTFGDYSNSRECQLLPFGKALNSCSQPNLEIAKELLDNSSKLQQLINLLHKECGCSVDESLISLKVQPKVSRKRRKPPKKVLILSSLPEILYVTSVFLNSAGISHELLMPFSGSDMNMAHLPSPSFSGILYWIQCQQAICRFEGTSDSGAFDILLSCPETLGSISSGLSAANAEVLISLDEDWSGRSDFLIYSILMKNCIQADSGGGRKFIKLIAEDTCEQSFLTFTRKVKGRSSFYPIPLFMSTIKRGVLDRKGYLSVDKDDTLDRDVTLGVNVMRCINVELSTVLCNQASLPPLATASLQQRFLMDSGNFCSELCEPTARKYEEDLINLGNIISSLVDDNNFIKSIIPDSWRSKSIKVAKAMIEIEAKALLNMRTKLQSNFKTFEIASTFTARDSMSKPVQGYVRGFRKFSQLYGSGCAQKEPIKIPTRTVDKVSGKSQRGKISELKLKEKTFGSSQSIRKSLGSCAGKVLSSLLMYSADSLLANTKVHSHDTASIAVSVEEQEMKMKEEKSNERKNLFVLSYSNYASKLDGNQGNESIVYFPPLFPGLRVGRTSMSKQDLPDSALDEMQSKKRKGLALERYPASKKLRTSNSLLAHGKSASFQEILPNETIPPLPIQQKDISSDLNLITSSDADFIEQTSALFDDEFLPDLTLDDKDNNVLSEEVSFKAEATIFREELDEDFGLLGSGLFSSIEYQSPFDTSSHTWSNQHSFWLDPFEPTLSNAKSFSQHCDTEEASNQTKALSGPQLDYVIIRVKLQKRLTYDDKLQTMVPGFPSVPSSSSYMPKMTLPLNMGVSNTNNMRLPGHNDGASYLHDGTQLGQKKKKKGSEKKNSLTPPIPGALPLPSNSLNLNVSMNSKPTLAMSHQMLPTRNNFKKERDQVYTSSLMPPSVHFARPYVLVQKNLLNLTSSNLTMDTGIVDLIPPLLSIRLLCENERTGDMSIEKSLVQRKQFFDSSQIKITNFVPFSNGFLFEPETNNHERFSSRVGIKLPMGVKVPHRHRDFERSLLVDEKWTDEQDIILKKSVARYGCNWNIACQALTWNSGDVCLKLHSIRSARQCLNRWKDLTQQQDRDCLHNQQQKFGMLQGNIPEKLNFPVMSGSLQVVVEPTSIVDHKKEIETPAIDIKARSRRLKKASSKRHIVPLTVPGYRSDSDNTNTQIQTLPSHVSHLQAVQDAVMAAGSNSAKLEMWPLQFLDVAENRRQNSLKRHQNSSMKSPQTHAPNNHQHASQHGIHQSSSSSIPNTMQQQATQPPTHGAVPPRPNVSRGQDPAHTPVKPTYGHSMHPNSAPRARPNHR